MIAKKIAQKLGPKFSEGQSVVIPSAPSAHLAKIERVVGKFRGRWMYQVSYEIFDDITPQGSGKRNSQPWFEDELAEQSRTAQTVPKDGTILNSKEIDFTGDYFNRSHATDPGFYVYFGMWKGPFESAEEAKNAYREWAWESKHS